MFDRARLFAVAVLLALPGGAIAQSADIGGTWHATLTTQTEVGDGGSVAREFQERWTVVQNGDSVVAVFEPAETAPGRSGWKINARGSFISGEIILTSEPVETRVRGKRGMVVSQRVISLRGDLTARGLVGMMHTTRLDDGSHGPMFTFTAIRSNGVAIDENSRKTKANGAA